MSRTSFSSTKGDSTEIETDLTLNDRLKVFKTSQFDPDAYVTSKCQAMNEKEIRHLCSYLVNLKKASAEEMRKSVYANYSAFIRTSKEISDLEGQLFSLKNLLSTQASLTHGLADGFRMHSLSSGPDNSTREEGLRKPSKMERWVGEFLDTLEVLLAEKRVEEALSALDEGENIAKEAKGRLSLTPTTLSTLQKAITEQRQKLAEQLAETICQPSTRGIELRSSVLALKKLGDGVRAHTLLLASHSQKLNRNIKTSVVGTSISTGSLSQLVFSIIAQAATDSQALFGEEPAYTSELVIWGVTQTETFAHIVKRHVLGSWAAGGCLRAASECVQTCMSHCSLLQDCGLALSPVLLRVFKPCVEQALTGNLKRIEQSSAALAAEDNWSLAYPPLALRILSTTSLSNAIASQPKLSSSAHRFNSMLQEMLEDVRPLESMQLSSKALEGLVQLFNSYITILVSALPGSMENEENPRPILVSIAHAESQQIALLANALLLSDELLPRAALKFSSSNQQTINRRQTHCPEQRELKKRLQRSVDRLRDSFCRHHALELIFTEDGDPRLIGQMYLALDESEDEPSEWFPSPIFQELFAKLNWIGSIATDMFVGRERFLTVLLMRLTETVILWLSDDQSFWEAIEEGPNPLGSLGLRQFYLDMEFVILFSSQGRYLSRNLHQIMRNIIGRAVDASASTGIDPYSMMPGDEWFVETCELAIKMISGKVNFDNEEQDGISPSASISAKSISSVLSHGSN